MTTKKPTTKPAPKKSTAVNQKKGLAKKKSFFSWKYAALFIALIAAVGGYIVYSSFAATAPKNLISTAAVKTGNRYVWAKICQSGQNRIYVRFTKDDGDKYTDYAPELVFARDGVRTGQITGYKTWSSHFYAAAAYTEGYQLMGNQAMGNRKADDTIKVKFGNGQGAAMRWKSVPYCQY